MTLLTSLLRPSEFDPSQWDNPDVGQRIHHASQCLYQRDAEAIRSALNDIPDNLQGDLRQLHIACRVSFHMQQIEVPQALALYEQVRLSIDLSVPSGALVGYFGVQALLSSSRQEEALDILAIIEDTFRRHNEHLAVALTLSLIGGCLSDIGDTHTAIRYFLQASDMLHEHGTSRQCIRSSLNLCFNYVQIARYQDSLDLSKQLIDEFIDELEPPEYSLLYGAIQRATEFLGQYEESMRWVDLHDMLAREHNVEFLVRNLAIDRGVVLMYLERYEEALALLSTIDIANPPGIMADLRVRHAFAKGVCLQHFGRKHEARESYHRITTCSVQEGVSFHILITTLKHVFDSTKDDPEIFDLAVYNAYLHLLEARVAEQDANSSRIIDIHARYATRLAQYQRERDEQLHTTLLEAGEEARRDIATSIHDGAGQELAVLGMQLDMALHELPTDHPSREHVVKARDRVSQTARQLRSLSHALGTHMLERDGLPSALYSMASDLRSTSRINVSCYVDEHLAAIPNDLARSIYRTVQTLTSNTLQHAFASNLDIAVTAGTDAIIVHVKDDGNGIDMTTCTEGLGWRSIRARVELRRGSFAVTSSPGGGMSTRAVFPYATT